MKRKTVGVLIVFTLMSIIPLHTTAQSFVINGVRYTISGGAATARSDFRSTLSGQVAILDSVSRNGAKYPVKSLAQSAFAGCTEITGITLPRTLTSIDDMSFYNCVKLKSITLPAALKAIGQSAFSGCDALETISIPDDNPNFKAEGCNIYNKDKTALLFHAGGDSAANIASTVKNIGDHAFYSCRTIRNLTLPENVTTLGRGALGSCSNLTQLNIGKNLKDIAYDALTNCDKLDKIVISPDNPYYYAEGGTIYSKDSTTIVCHVGSDTAFAIPSGVTSVGDWAFLYCKNLKSVTIPEGVKSIGESAFRYSGLEKINIPPSVNSIGDFAFGYLRNLDSVFVDWETPPDIPLATFMNVGRNCALCVPNNATSAYKSSAGWAKIRTVVELLNDIAPISYRKDALSVSASGNNVTLNSERYNGAAAIVSTAGETLETLNINEGETKISKHLSAGIYIIATKAATYKVSIK